LKGYLDNGKADGSELLTKQEREVLLKELSKEKNKKKVIGVYLDDKYSSEVPNLLQGVDIVDGVGGMDDIVEVKIPARVTAK